MNNDKLKKWLKWLKVIEKDIQELRIKQNIFWEVQDIIKNNSDLDKPSSFYNFLGDTYVAYICIGIRRQAKVDQNSISFTRLLTEIIEDPEILSRDFYVGLYKGSSVEEDANDHFDKYFFKNGETKKDYISTELVEADLVAFQEAVIKIEGFADRRIAHHDKREPKEIPKFKEVDECLQIMDELYTKYHLFFYAQDQSLMPVYQYNWKEIFEVPWIK